jgi:hypothetical protein
VNQDLAYKLTRALAGKELSEEKVTPLNEAVVQMIESAFECRDKSTSLRDSPTFRDAAAKAWTALQALGLSTGELRIVSAALFRGAEMEALPPIEMTFR